MFALPQGAQPACVPAHIGAGRVAVTTGEEGRAVLAQAVPQGPHQPFCPES